MMPSFPEKLPENRCERKRIVLETVNPVQSSETLFGGTPESKTDTEREAKKLIR
jgi:hypothetical protein